MNSIYRQFGLGFIYRQINTREKLILNFDSEFFYFRILMHMDSLAACQIVFNFLVYTQRYATAKFLENRNHNDMDDNKK